MDIEIQLNRGWIVDEDGKVIGEHDFVVPELWLVLSVEELCNVRFEDADDYYHFLDTYVPEEEGMAIYHKSLEDNTIVAERDYYFDKAED